LDLPPQQADLDRIEEEITEILDDEVFQRSPVMARLLSYLFEMTAKGSHIKSYTIAIDALGKSEGDTSDADTYARVAVARLRKALAAYYAARPKAEALHIDAGTYRVHLVPHSTEGQASQSDQLSSPFKAALGWLDSFSRAAWISAVITVLLIFAGAYFYFEPDEAPEDWTTSNFPQVAISFENPEGQPAEADEMQETFHSLLTGSLSDYAGIDLLTSGNGKPDFRLHLQSSGQSADRVFQARLVEEATGKVVWLKSFPVSDTQAIKRSAVSIATIVGSPGGAIASLNRGGKMSARSPYGCWLRFTENLQTFNIADAELAACASDWYSHADNQSLAAFLYSWTLIDRATMAANRDEREALLGQALSVANRAASLHPQDATLYVVQMRAHIFRGNHRLTQQAAERALANAPNNRVVVGFAAYLLALCNDPKGEEILISLEEDDRDIALPWEHAGHFVAAMMRDDVEAAGEHMVHLEQFAYGQPLLLLFKAAHARRSGNSETAQAALRQLRAHPQAAGQGNDELVARLPMAPEVKARLKEWLAYSMPETPQ